MPAAAGPESLAQPSVKVDVVDAITARILQQAASVSGDCSDIAVVAALRGCLTGKAPSGDQSALLWRAVEELSAQPGVTTHAFRKAVNQLLSEQKKHRDTNDPSAFVAYLEFMAQ